MDLHAVLPTTAPLRRKPMPRRLVLLIPMLLAGAASARAADDDAEFFEKRVRPLLVTKCLECHGDVEPEAGLRLTARRHLLKGGDSGPGAIANDPAKSLLVQAIARKGDLEMPPDEPLSEREIATLTKWVALGLPWPESLGLTPRVEPAVTEADREHWAFRPIADPTPPAVKDVDWPGTNIDRFVLAKLEAAGLRPAPPADRRTLIRRAYYDLIGLPPTWREVKAFVDDPASTSDALGGVIDRLLASARYGERWARHWLDVARFADTKDGVLMYGDDRIRPYAYTYRDYVVRAFNEDLPFDRFVHEQLAADLIEPKVEPWRLAAMGFLTLGRMYDNNVHDVIDDRIDTVSRGMLGLTVSCARCHDHKYDPIPMADYYSLYGVFASSEAPLVLPLTDLSENVPGGVEFEKLAAPKRAELLEFLDEQYRLLSDDARSRVGAYLVHVATTKPDPLETAIFFLSLAPEDLRPPIVARWRRYLARRATPDDPFFGPWHDLMALSDSQTVDDAAAGSVAPSFEVRVAAVLESWFTKPEGTEPGQLNPLVRAALSAPALSSRADVARAYGALLERVAHESANESEATDAAPPDEATRQALEVVIGRESPTRFPKSRTRRYMSRKQTDAFGAKLKELDRMAVKSANAPPRGMVLLDAPTLHEPRIFVRGNPSRPGAPVPRRFLAISTPSERRPFPNGSGRLDLAKAITAPENPLTARVIVNRVWMYHFAEPLVATPSDFGNRSTPPTHPALLDHLTTRFLRDGWSLKRLHRRIMMSNAYRQASRSNPEEARARSIDADNRLLWRMNRKRLDFEAMRDTLLAVSGRLRHRLAGRPVDVAKDPKSRVRTIYGLVDRQDLPGVFRAFDFATPDQSVERRSRTMVPQQALFALNSPFMVEQAKALAARPEIVSLSDPTARVGALYRTAYAREPTPEELAEALEFVSVSEDAGSQLAAWELLAQVLLASNELMYLD